MFVGRFFSPVQALIALAAGVCDMRRLPLANFPSATVWATGILAPAYFGCAGGMASDGDDAGAGKWAPLSGLVLVVPKRAAQAGFLGCPVGDDHGDLLVVEAMDRSLSSC